MISFPRWVIADLRAAASLLTRLPVSHDTVPAAREVWAYPVVGLGVGACGAAIYSFIAILHGPALLAALWAIAAMIVLTGGLHEDGLADTADGFGGGGMRARKLEIMRDSRIGSFGALALLLSVSIRAGAISAMAGVGGAAAAIVVAAVLGRAAMIVPLAALAPARADGLAATLGARDDRACAGGFAVAAVVALVLLPVSMALASVAVAGIVAVAIAVLARRQIGGYTGDVLGASEQAVECVVLTVLACSVGL